MLLADDLKKNNISPKKICVGLQPSECKFNLYQKKKQYEGSYSLQKISEFIHFAASVHT